MNRSYHGIGAEKKNTKSLRACAPSARFSICSESGYFCFGAMNGPSPVTVFEMRCGNPGFKTSGMMSRHPTRAERSSAPPRAPLFNPHPCIHFTLLQMQTLAAFRCSSPCVCCTHMGYAVGVDSAGERARVRARTAVGGLSQAEGRDHHSQRRLGQGGPLRRAAQVPPTQVIHNHRRERSLLDS